MEISSELKDKIANIVMEWWHEYKRDFPWRRERDPYKVLITLVLLKKTTARQVARVYDRFFGCYPCLESLACADLEELKRVLRPLGLYNTRAPILVSLARVLLEEFGGVIPRDRETLVRLPGVKDYTANAFLVFMYNVDLPLVDTNVTRFITRFFGLNTKSIYSREVMEIAAKLIPKGKSRDFNLALLDFSSLVCTARKPKCNTCPLNTLCKSASRSD